MHLLCLDLDFIALEQFQQCNRCGGYSIPQTHRRKMTEYSSFLFVFSFLISSAEAWQDVIIVKEARVVALFKMLLSDFAWHLQMLEVLLNKLLWWLSFVKAAYQRKLDMTFLTYLDSPQLGMENKFRTDTSIFFYLGET